MRWIHLWLPGVIALLPLSRAESPAPPSPRQREAPSGLSARWVFEESAPHRARVEVVGLDPATLQELRSVDWAASDWEELLSVFAAPADSESDAALPPMAGRHRVGETSVFFEPRFPLVAGMRYRAVFKPEALPGQEGSGQETRRPAGPLSASVTLPSRQREAATRVAEVYPTADVLPENLLKFYLHFSAPMSRGRVYEHIHLLRENGAEVELPFLEIDEELWDSGLTRLTLFIDPGRIKREVKPLEDIGPALEEGKRFQLTIDRAWKDANGAPLEQGFTKSFSAGPPDREPLDPGKWDVIRPLAGSRQPLRTRFLEPVDHALALRMIHVARRDGGLVDGTAALENRESEWTFRPHEAWQSGSYRLIVQTTLEDLAGNNIGKPFEVDLVEPIPQRLVEETVSVPFEIP